MAPAYSSSSPAELQNDQKLEILIPSYHHPSHNSLSCPTFFNTTQDHSEFQDTHQQQGKIQIKLAGSISPELPSSSSSSSIKPLIDHGDRQGQNSATFQVENEDEKPLADKGLRWMSSKMRVMHKMMNNSSNCSSSTSEKPLRFRENKPHQDHHTISSSNGRNGNTGIRVCADCNTTTTPLWRSGPQGPKSLCNACGIRQRKARKAMEEAASGRGGGPAAMEASSSSSAKIKKSRSSYSIVQSKKQLERSNNYSPGSEKSDDDQYQSQKKLCFEDFALNLSKNSAFQKVFPRDEEQAAILLMELSCGLVHS